MRARVGGSGNETSPDCDPGPAFAGTSCFICIAFTSCFVGRIWLVYA